MVLRPLDLLLMLKLVAHGDRPWTQKQIGNELGVNLADINASVKRCKAARLLNMVDRTILRRNLEEFVIHGAKYAFPAERGGPTIGLATGFAAPPLSSKIIADGAKPVWPDSNGPSRGYQFMPLHKAAVNAARYDPKLYELLTLFDAIRDGGARETNMANDELSRRIRVAQ